MARLLPQPCPRCHAKPPGPQAKRLPSRCPGCGRWLRWPVLARGLTLSRPLALASVYLDARPGAEGWLLPTRAGPVRLELPAGRWAPLPAPQGLAAVGLARLPEGSLLVAPWVPMGRARPWRITPAGQVAPLAGLPEAPSWSPPLAEGRRVWLTDGEGRVWALQAPEMQVLWSRTFPAPKGRPMSPVLQAGVLVVVTGRGVVGLDPATGATRWQADLGPTPLRGDVPLEPDPRRPVVYAGLGGRLYRMEVATGQVREIFRAPRVSSVTGRGFFGRLRATEQGLLAAHTASASRQYALSLLDPETGAVLWRYAIRGGHPYVPVVVLPAAETDWVLLPHRRYRAAVFLDLRDGREVHRLPLPEPPVAEPVVHEDRVYLFYGALTTGRPPEARGLAVLTGTLTPEVLPEIPAHALFDQGRRMEAALKWAWEGYPWIAAWVYAEAGHPDAARWAFPQAPPTPPQPRSMVAWWEQALGEGDWETLAEVLRRRLEMHPPEALQALEAALPHLPPEQALRTRLAGLLERAAWPTWEAGERARGLAARLLVRPALQAEMKTQDVLHAGRAGVVTLRVRNQGHGPAHEVRITLRASQGRADVLEDRGVTLEPGAAHLWRIRVQPTAPGEMALSVHLTYRDYWGVEQALEVERTFVIAEKQARRREGQGAPSLPDLLEALVGLALTLVGRPDLAPWASKAAKALLKALKRQAEKARPPRGVIPPEEVAALLEAVVAALPEAVRADLAADRTLPPEALEAALAEALRTHPALRRRLAALLNQTRGE